ncbi:MAG: site-2 protease family protein [bacterium]|nr:site-2 protease family protein [bacterium]
MLIELLFSRGWVFNIYGISLLITYSFVFTSAFLYWISHSFLKGGWKVNSKVLAFLGMLTILASVIFHELSHAVVAGFFGTQIDKVGLVFLGAYVTSSDTSLLVQNSWPAMLVIFAGPAGQIFFGVVCAKIFHRLSESKLKMLMWLGALVSVRFGVLNLMPLVGFIDGGQFILKLLKILGGENYVNLPMVMTMISFASLLFFIKHGIPSTRIEKYLKI